VEYPCYRCGATVEEGIAFCPQCNAPQIRVAVAEPLTRSVAATDQDAALPSYPYLMIGPAARIDWSKAMPATALAGLIAAVLMMTPLAAFGLGMLIGGILSVVFYRRRNPVTNVTPRMGSRLGMASGAIGGAIFTVLLFAATAALHGWEQIREKVIEVVAQTAARNPDPQAQQALEFFKTEQGISLLVASGLVVTFIAFVIFSGLGGALGAVLLRRKE
jgi:hypothetical protein